MRGIRTYLLRIYKLFIIGIVLLQICVLYRTRSGDTSTVQLLLRNTYKERLNLSRTLKSIEAHNSSHLFEIIRQDIDLNKEIPSRTSRPDGTRFLTVGISTVRRYNYSYLLQTIDSLLKALKTEETSEIFLVIFLADFNSTWKQYTADILEFEYENLIKNNTIKLIEAPEDFYPKLDNLSHTFNDSETRTKWRSKQNVDYAFLWLYSRNLSEYYIQIEDDVMTNPNFLEKIKKFISIQKKPWICLEFSNEGFIGKLYHSFDLEMLAKYVLLFYDQQPVDFLLRYFLPLNLQDKQIIHNPRIFHHVGYHSSLSGKLSSVEIKFLDRKKSLLGDNPRAEFHTTIKGSQKLTMAKAYSREDGCFLSESSPVINDTIHIRFYRSQSIKKVVVVTGSRQYPNDILKNAQLDACIRCQAEHGHVKCLGEFYLGSFVNGTVVASNLHSAFNNQQIACLRITVLEDQFSPLIIKEIAVFTR